MSRYEVVRPVIAAYEALLEGNGAPLPQGCTLMLDLKRVITLLKAESVPTVAAVEETLTGGDEYARAMQVVHNAAEQLDSAIGCIPPRCCKDPAVDIADARIRLIKARIRVETLDPTPKRKD